MAAKVDLKTEMQKLGETEKRITKKFQKWHVFPN